MASSAVHGKRHRLQRAVRLLAIERGVRRVRTGKKAARLLQRLMAQFKSAELEIDQFPGLPGKRIP